MGKLLLLALIAAGIYWAHGKWFASEPATTSENTAPANPSPAVAKAKPVDFAIKSRVRGLLEEWKRRQLGGGGVKKGVATIKPDQQLKLIREHLFRAGRYSDSAMNAAVADSLRELGVAEEELGNMTGEILSMGDAGNRQR